MTPPLGIIEGFFGRPWSWPERAAAIRFLRPYGYGFYLYAPKADPYLRRRWQEPHPAAEIRIGLGRVEVEAIAVRPEEADGRGPLRPGPGPAEKTLDDAERRGHAASTLIAAWTRASISARGRPGSIGARKRMVTMPGRLTNLPLGQSLPESTATGTTGSFKMR